MSSASNALRRAMDRFQAYCSDNSHAYMHDLLMPTQAEPSPSSTSESEPLTVFHTHGRIAMTLVEFAGRMQRRLKCADEVLATALALCERYATSALPVTYQMLHRLFIAALHVGMKAHDDHFYSLEAFAIAAGVQKRELDRLERQFILDIDFRCVVLVPRAELASHATPLEALVAHCDAQLNVAQRVRCARSGDRESSEDEWTIRLVALELPSPSQRPLPPRSPRAPSALASTTSEYVTSARQAAECAPSDDEAD